MRSTRSSTTIRSRSARSSDTDLKFAVTKLDGSNIAYKIGVRADDRDLLIYLNAAIAKLKQSPQYLDLLRKYFVSEAW